MLKTFYSLLLLLTGDLESNILGPIPDHGQNDVGLITRWLSSGDAYQQNRGIWAIGSGFVESNIAAGGVQTDLMTDYFGVDLADREKPDYRDFCGITDDVLNLRVFPGWRGGTGDIVYGVRSPGSSGNDALLPVGSVSQAASQYEPMTGGCTATASVFRDWGPPASPWKALVDGWNIKNLTNTGDVSGLARMAYFYEAVSQVWAKFCKTDGTPLIPLDVPGSEDLPPLTRFVEMRNNPVTSRMAELHFGLAPRR